MILNRQSEARVDLRDARRFAHRLRSALRLGKREFNVCFIGDKDITTLNKTYRKKACATDVLSFPWSEGAAPDSQATREFDGFLGDVVISARTARRNARAAGHSFRTEIHWLILHGVLHLLGYDHEADSGQMAALELGLRDRLNGRWRAETRQKS
jgi:probable rRNA maturation factor